MKDLTNMIEMELLEAIGCDGEYTDTYPVALVNEIPVVNEDIMVLNNCKATVTDVTSVSKWQDNLDFINKDLKFYTIFFDLENGLHHHIIIAL